MERRRRILLVDDEPDALASLQALLATVPRSAVVPAASFAEAMAAVHRGPWDMVIADERLPDGRGTELLAHLARLRPGAVRVLMTAHRDYDILAAAINRARAERLFEKPMDPEEMLRWVVARLDEADASVAGGVARRLPPSTGVLALH